MTVTCSKPMTTRMATRSHRKPGMKRYGQRTITLKDMVIEHLMECMEAGATIAVLRKELGGTTHALTKLLEKMVADGEAIKLKPQLGDELKRVDGNPAWAVSANAVVDGLKDRLEDVKPVELALDAESIAHGERILSASWKVDRPVETYKLSPRMWIEAVAEA